MFLGCIFTTDSLYKVRIVRRRVKRVQKPGIPPRAPTRRTQVVVERHSWCRQMRYTYKTTYIAWWLC